MSPEMYTILGVGVGLLAVMVALFAATWQMMNARFAALSSDVNARFADMSNDVNGRFATLSNDMNARFEESNERFLLMVEQNRQLISEVSQLSQRVARLEGLLRLPHEADGHGDG